MTVEEFMKLHRIKNPTIMDEVALLSVLDHLYLEFTREQAIAIVADYYDHADEIHNDQKETVQANLSWLSKVFG